MELEVGVLREEEDEALAHGAGAAEDTCVSSVSEARPRLAMDKRESVLDRGVQGGSAYRTSLWGTRRPLLLLGSLWWFREGSRKEDVVFNVW